VDTISSILFRKHRHTRFT